MKTLKIVLLSVISVAAVVGFTLSSSEARTAEYDCANTCKWNGNDCVKATMGCWCGGSCGTE